MSMVITEKEHIYETYLSNDSTLAESTSLQAKHPKHSYLTVTDTSDFSVTTKQAFTFTLQRLYIKVSVPYHSL